jgi:hypothetical protein
MVASRSQIPADSGNRTPRPELGKNLARRPLYPGVGDRLARTCNVKENHSANREEHSIPLKLIAFLSRGTSRPFPHNVSLELNENDFNWRRSALAMTKSKKFI